MANELPTIEQAAGGCAGVLKVLADTTRLAVVERLMAGPLNVGEINETLSLEQSLLSHHLKVLRQAGLVTAKRQGKQVIYSLAKAVQSRGRAVDLGCCRLSFDKPQPRRRGKS